MIEKSPEAGDLPGSLRERVIPALREWTPASGGYTLGAGSRVVVDAGAGGELDGVAAVLADDLSARQGHRPAIVTCAASAAEAGDIVLSLAPAQGYRLAVGAMLEITAPDVVGVFYGTRSVLQLLAHANTIPAGVARDWPGYPERGVHIDSAHRRYTAAWWRNLVRDLAYLKLNQLTVDLYPKGVTDELIEITARYHVTVIPHLSIPSHAGDTILRERPEYALHPGGPAPASEALDFTKPGALELIQGWVEREARRWPGPYWHGGAGEFLAFPGQPINWRAYPQFERFARQRTGDERATGRDAYVWLLNWLAGMLAAHGKALRLRSDHLEAPGVLVLDPSIVVEHRVGAAAPTVLTPQDLAGAGHLVVNADEDLLHYDNGRHVDARKLHGRFDVGRFAGGHTVTGPAAARVAGAQLTTWMARRDPGTPAESNEELAANLFAPLRVLAQATWDSPRPNGGYERLRGLMRRLGHAPGHARTGGTVTGDPAAATGGNGRLAYFSADTGGVLWYASRTNVTDAWDAPTPVAERVTGSPAAVTLRGGALAYLARTTEGQLLHGWQTGSASDGWLQETLLTAHAAGDPAAAVDRDGRLHYMLRTGDGQLVHGRHGPASWRQENVPVPPGGDPAVLTDPQGGLHLFCRAEDGRLCHAWQPDSGADWQQETIAGGAAGRPAAVFDQRARLMVFTRTLGAQLQWGVRDASGWQWRALADDIAGDPAAACDLNGRVVYFARTGDDGLRHGWQITPRGPDWNSDVLTDAVGGTPAVAADVNSRMTYFVTTPYGHLRHGWQRTPGTGPWLRTTLIGQIEP